MLKTKLMSVNYTGMGLLGNCSDWWPGQWWKVSWGLGSSKTSCRRKKAKSPLKKIKHPYSVLKPPKDSSLKDYDYVREAKIVPDGVIRIHLKRNNREFLESFFPASKMRQIKLRLSHIIESDQVMRANLIMFETQLLLGEVTSVISSDESILFW